MKQTQVLDIDATRIVFEGVKKLKDEIDLC